MGVFTDKDTNQENHGEQQPTFKGWHYYKTSGTITGPL